MVGDLAVEVAFRVFSWEAKGWEMLDERPDLEQGSLDLNDVLWQPYRSLDEI